MEKRINHDHGIVAFIDIITKEIHDIADIGNLTGMAAGYTLGKSGGPTGIHDIGQIIIGIDVDGWRLRRSLAQKFIKTIDVLPSDGTALRDFINQIAENPLPGVEHVNQVGNNYTP